MKTVCLTDCVLFTLGINNKESLWKRSHITDATEVKLKLQKLLVLKSLLLLRKSCHTTILYHCLKLLKALNAGTHGNKVGKHTTKPTLVDIRHICTSSLSSNWLLSLLLGANKKNSATLRCNILQKSVSSICAKHSLLKVKNVNAVTITKNVWLHLRVPTTSLVTIVATSIQKSLNSNLCSHFYLHWLFLRTSSSLVKTTQHLA